MSTITLPNIRVSSDLTIRLKLKDGGVAIDWSTLQNIRVSLYADDQRSMASRCNVSIDEEDSTILVCQYAANKMQYLGVNRVIVQCKYMGEVKTYDKPAFNFVRWTSDQEGEQITIDDPDVDVEISVEDVSSSILQEAVDAAFSAADRANEAAEEAEHMVDIHTGPAGKSPYIGENGHWYEWDEETHQYVDTETNAKGDTGETPDISIGTVTTVEPGTPAAASMGGTPEAPVLNLSIPKGLVGATPNFTVGTVTTGEPGSSVIVTITGTPEAPVLNVTIPQGMQGNTGSSVDYPYELVNNLTTNDATKGLSAAQGVVLDGKVSQLEAKVDGEKDTVTGSGSAWYYDASVLTEGSILKLQLVSNAGSKLNIFANGNTMIGSLETVGEIVSIELSASYNSLYFYQGTAGSFVINVIKSEGIQGEINTINQEIVALDNATQAKNSLSSRNEAATSSSINVTIDLTAFANNTQFELDITNASHTAYFFIKNTNDVNCVEERFTGAKKFYFEKTAQLKSIQLYMSASAGNVLNYNLYQLNKNVPLENRTGDEYTICLSQLQLGKPFRGYWTSPNTVFADATWVCYPIQFQRGGVIHISADFSTYYVSIHKWTEDFSTAYETVISQETDLDLSLFYGWHLQFRRQDRAQIDPELVDGDVVIQRVGGNFWDKPASQNEFVLLRDRVGRLEYPPEKRPSIFANAPFYAHLAANGFIKDDDDNNIIASESLEDVALSARLGFKFVEANIIKLADDNFICIHGTNGAFGPEVKSADENVITTEDLQTTQMNTVTVSWVKQYVRYNSALPKYQTTIPTLEEFCKCCKENNIGLFAGTTDKDAIEICQKYLGNNLILYGPSASVREYYKDYVFVWNNNETYTLDGLLSTAKSYGVPYMLGVGPGLMNKLIENNEFGTLIELFHQNGFYIGIAGVYQTEEESRTAFKAGIDFSGSGWEVNPFDANYEVYDSECNLPSTTGSINDGVITLANGETISCGNATKIIGKGSLTIKFNGEITVNFGSKKNNYRQNIVSNGSEYVVISDYYFMQPTTLLITAEDATTITHFVYKTSKV